MQSFIKPQKHSARDGSPGRIRSRSTRSFLKYEIGRLGGRQTRTFSATPLNWTHAQFIRHTTFGVALTVKDAPASVCHDRRRQPRERLTAGRRASYGAYTNGRWAV